MGKQRIAQVLCRAGLHLGVTTVGRMLTKSVVPDPVPASASARRIRARQPNHVWHVDLTTVPTGAGLWTSWLPWALPQRWPFCWWVVVVADHFSRRVMGVTSLSTTGDGPRREDRRFEPRSRWPRAAPCAGPHAPVAGLRGARLALSLRFLGKHQRLPIVELKRAV